MGIAPKRLKRFKDRLRRITRRNRGISLNKMVLEVNSFTTGWVMYYRHARCQRTLGKLDGWIRRKLRCVRLKHCKRTKSIADFLIGNGVPTWPAWLTALSGKGWWRLAGNAPVQQAMGTPWFEALGLLSLTQQHVALNPGGNRRIR